MIYPDNPPEITLHAYAWELYDALRDLLSRAEGELDQTATHDGLENCDALARCRETIRRAADIT
jgi:hypothetical protein